MSNQNQSSAATEITTALTEAEAEAKEAAKAASSVRGIVIEMSGRQIKQIEQSNQMVKTLDHHSDKLTEMEKRQLAELRARAIERAERNAGFGQRFSGKFEETEVDGQKVEDLDKPVYETSAWEVTKSVGKGVATLGLIVLAGYAGGKAAQPRQTPDEAPPVDLGDDSSEY